MTFVHLHSTDRIGLCRHILYFFHSSSQAR
jgi:hypothetical protein